MNGFDKFCAVLAFPLGCVFLVLGLLGVFTGCRAHFTLPAILGGLPALVGWGIVRSVVVAWRQPPKWEPPPWRSPGHYPDSGLPGEPWSEQRL